VFSSKSDRIQKKTVQAKSRHTQSKVSQTFLFAVTMSFAGDKCKHRFSFILFALYSFYGCHKGCRVYPGPD